MSTVWVTTSWDDGHASDARLAALLDRYDMPGTFYVAPRSVELARHERLGRDALLALAERFEIGGHTLTHRRLTSLSRAAAAEEIRAGKDELEQALGARLRSFCYPGGRYGADHVALVREAGFTVARTVRRNVTAPPSDLLRAGTTIHAYRHYGDALRCRPGASWRRWWNWDQSAMRLFDDVCSTGGVFHLWGHSWEIDAHGDWGRVERVLRHIGRRRDVRYIVNGRLAETTMRPPVIARARA
jgi:peptidoglycan/xylan/chitin deacetylase (PgdA/CDA1 family)